MQSTTSSHHHHHHTEEHFEQSATVRDIVIGMADGLTVPFALAAGLSTAVSTNGIIVTAGFAEIVAGSIAMGLGGYLAGKTEIEHYDAELKREYSELTTHYDTERREVKEILNRARMSARNIGVAYIVGGTVPLMAYIFTETPNEGLIYSSIITVVCLMFFGYFKSKATGQDPVKGGFRTTMIGVLAAAAAYFFAHLFTNL